MAQTKAGLTKLTVGGQVQLARTMVTKMTGNSNFTTPSPTLTALTTAADALEAANNAAVAARSTAKLATTTQEDKQAILLGLLNLEISYVQNITGGDKTKIESAGLSVRNTPAPVGPLPAPVSIEVNTNTDPGMMKISWASVRNAKSYTLDRAPDSTGPLVWSTIAVPTTRKVTVNSMTSGARYWFRVAAVNAAGTGLFTAATSRIAP